MLTWANSADSCVDPPGCGTVAAFAHFCVRFRKNFTLCVLASWLALSGIDAARAQEKTRHILVLHPYNTTVRVSALADDAMKRRLTERSREPLEFYTEFLDLGRFPGDEHEARMVRHLADKYRDRKPTVVLAMGPPSLRFLVQNRDILGYDAPVVFCCHSSATLATQSVPADATGIITEFDLTKTLALAQLLQPDARSIVVVSGADAFDRQWSRTARGQLAGYEGKYDVKYLEGLAYADLLDKLKSLDRSSVVILLSMLADGAGRFFIQPEMARDVAGASGAPVYTPYEGQLGTGVIGGFMNSFERIGNEVAELALDVLAGVTPSAIPPRPTTGGSVKVDWRQLKRWDINESRLPAGSEVHFREFSVWERYRWHIAAVVFLVLAQAAGLAWMFIERRRRRIAQAALQQRLLEIIHLNRTATASALSASVAHELNQPLAAIQSYADAAAIYLKASPPNIARVEEILANIRSDNQRAAEIISHFRGLLRKSEAFDLQELDINDVVRSTVRIIHSEALKRGVSLSAHHAEALLPVRADQVHLQQVVLNLAVNGLDAMQNCAAGTGKISIQTALVGDSVVEVSIADSGTGIPADMLNAVFDTFYTTKRQGTGLGLSISRTIVEAYGGRIWAENRPGGGAAFRFTLPLSRGVSA